METGDLATWVASGAAVVAVIVAGYERHQANKADAQRQVVEAQRQALEERNAELVARANRLKTQAWVDSHFQAVQRWAEDVCLAMSEGRHLVGSEREFAAQRLTLMARLSSLIDTGRWYFPNTHTEMVGTEKEFAYRGVRQPVLDYVVHAYRTLESSRPAEVLCHELISCQRQFVSDIQQVINPRRRELEIEHYLKQLPELDRQLQPTTPPRGESSPPLP